MFHVHLFHNDGFVEGRICKPLKVVTQVVKYLEKSFVATFM